MGLSFRFPHIAFVYPLGTLGPLWWMLVCRSHRKEALMPTDYVVKADHQGKMKVGATSGGLSVQMDYPVGCGTMTPLELLLISLAGCSISSMAVLLTRAKQTFDCLSVEVIGQRRDEHPTVFTDIELKFVLRGDALEDSSVEQALKMSEEKICPVWAMLKPGVPIRASYRIEK
jgi:putative redox protein